MTLNLEDHLLYRDALILVINKPGGIPVHKGPKGGETLDQYFDQLTFGLPRLPQLAHRLDRGTSGCLVLGRHRKALQKMMKLFKNGHIEKTYIAVVYGHVDDDEGIIDAPLGKKSQDKRSWHMKVDVDNGAPSLTEFTVIKRSTEGTPRTWLSLSPKTGRTHQLRVHCAHLGHPIMGDYIYADVAVNEHEPLMLHASKLIIPLYKNRAPLVIETPQPEYF